MAEEKTEKKTSSGRRFAVLIFILIVGAGVGAYALWRAGSFARTGEAPTARAAVTVPVRLASGLMPRRPMNPLIDPAQVREEVPEPDMPQDASVPVAADVPIYVPAPAHPNPAFVADLLQLRDALRSGRPCRDQMQALMAHPAAFGALVEELKPFCLTDANPHDRLRGDFARARRRILLAHYRAEKPWWKGYARYAGALFVDVRAQHPAGDAVPDVLDAALNALDNARLQEASDAVARLPAAVREDLRPFREMLDGLIRAQGLIDEAIARQVGGKT